MWKTVAALFTFIFILFIIRVMVVANTVEGRYHSGLIMLITDESNYFQFQQGNITIISSSTVSDLGTYEYVDGSKVRLFIDGMDAPLMAYPGIRGIMISPEDRDALGIVDRALFPRMMTWKYFLGFGY